MSETNTALTPYDTGERLEPQPWPLRRGRRGAPDDRCTQCGEELEDDDVCYGITVCDECSYSPFWNGMYVG